MGKVGVPAAVATGTPTGFDYELFDETTEPSSPDDFNLGCIETNFSEE